MVIQQHSETLSRYYLKPGQTIQNTKDHERPLALITPSSVFNRYSKYATEEKTAAISAENAKSLDKIRERDMPKEWTDKLKVINKMREERKIQKEKDQEAARDKFVKEMNEKKEIERGKVMEQARRLLLYRQPQCRIINRGLLQSECIRELKAQLDFETFLKEADEQQQRQYRASVQKDVEKFKNEERERIDEQMALKQRYKEQLINQINELRKRTEEMDQSEKNDEKKDLENMIKELESIKELEKKKNEEKKVKLKRLFTEALKEKMAYKKQEQMNEEMQNQARQLYAETKQKIQKMLKEKLEEEKREHSRQLELLANKVQSMKSEMSPEEEERQRLKVLKEKEAIEQEKLNLENERKMKLKLELEKNRQEELMARKKRLKEKDNWHLYEVLERMKKTQFNRDVQLQEQKRKIEMKQKYAEDLRKQITEKTKLEMERKRMADDSKEIEQILDFTNHQILSYGEEVIKESTGVRPLFPIIKAVNLVKKEIGIMPPKKVAEVKAPVVSSKKKKRRRPVFVKDLQDCQIVYLG